MNNKVLLITGSYPPDVCGVGDYAYNLLAANPDKFELYYSPKWHMRDVFTHIHAINSRKSTVLNIQYPTKGYGWSLIPHFLTIYYSLFSKRICSVTIHELSQASAKSKIALLFMLIFANKIIFTTEYERNYAVSLVKRVKIHSIVIKIASNIPAAKVINPISKRNIDVVYFGLIAPRKGIEQVIKDVEFYGIQNAIFVGRVSNRVYYEKIKNMSDESSIKFILDMPINEVSVLLNDSKIAYLPFPDGVSERRGSMLAAFSNGAVVLSSKGDYTTTDLMNSIVDMNECSLQKLLQNEELLMEKQKQAFAYVQKNIPASWSEIGTAYLIYLFDK